MPSTETVLASSDPGGWTGEAAHEDAGDGARSLYGGPGGTWAEVTVYRIPADKLVDKWQGGHRASMLVGREDVSELGEYEVSSWSGHIDEAEPDCRTGMHGDPHPDGHDWTSAREAGGGLRENPGVFGHGGGVWICEHCARCGAGRTRDARATGPSDGSRGHTVVTYHGGEGDAD